jgi:uncharacterized protein
MTQPDYAGAERYALERLERELPPNLFYHSVEHTRDEVMPAVERLAVLEGVDGEGLALLRTAAMYHDIGFLAQYVDNEPIAVRIAAQVLPRFGYAPAHLRVIDGLILATRLPQSPGTRLEEIIADADLDVLGREIFFERNRALRAEMAAYGTAMPDAHWHARQLEFLQSHRYFTAAARKLRNAQKQRNLERLNDLLAHYRYARTGHADLS